MLISRVISKEDSPRVWYVEQFKLSITQIPSIEVERDYIDSIPYASIVGYLMYVMVCNKPNIAYEVSLVSRYMAILGNEHYQALKWIPRYIK